MYETLAYPAASACEEIRIDSGARNVIINSRVWLVCKWD
jgi:hypothetical protein